MADKYETFAALAAAEPATAYAIAASARTTQCVVAAPHGGRIEPGTSEVATAIAGNDLSLYLFEGKKPIGNRDLHITSHHFDEPRAIRLVTESDMVLTIHGVAGNEKVAYIGGRDKLAGDAILRALNAAGFRAARHTNIALQGLYARNVCNLGRSRCGVQLELSRGLRRELVGSTVDNKKKGKPASSSRKLKDFAEVIRSVIMGRPQVVKKLRTRKPIAKRRRRKQGDRAQTAAVGVRQVSGKQLWAMKRKQQARDRARVAHGPAPDCASLLIRPHRMKELLVEWPDVPLVDD